MSVGFWGRLKQKLTNESRILEIRDEDLQPIEKCLGRETMVLDEDLNLSLLYALESSFCRLYNDGVVKEDGQVRSALEWLAGHRADNLDDDVIRKAVQKHLQIFLNLNPGKFSEGDIRRACNKILRSVERHRDARIEDAYLKFIQDYVS